MVASQAEQIFCSATSIARLSPTSRTFWNLLEPSIVQLCWAELALFLTFTQSSTHPPYPPSLLPSLSIPYLALPTAAAQSGRQRLKSVQDMSTFRVRGGLYMTTHTCHSTFEGCLQITAHFL